MNNVKEKLSCYNSSKCLHEMHFYLWYLRWSLSFSIFLSQRFAEAVSELWVYFVLFSACLLYHPHHTHKKALSPVPTQLPEGFCWGCKAFVDLHYNPVKQLCIDVLGQCISGECCLKCCMLFVRSPKLTYQDNTELVVRILGSEISCWAHESSAVRREIINSIISPCLLMI